MKSMFGFRALGRGSVASVMQIALECVWWLLWLGAGLLAACVIGYLAVLGLIAGGALDASVLEPGETQRTIGSVKIEVEHDEKLIWPVMAPAFLAGAVAIGGALTIVGRLKRLFKNFTSGEPFSSDNAGHLRVIWMTMLVMELSRYLIAGTVWGLVLVFGQPESTAIDVQAPVNFTTWGAILVLIVLAEVFREGARLREEQDLTI